MSSSLRRRSDPASPRWFRVLLLVGFLALAGAVLAARSKPAIGYEVSIYRATPLAFWIGLFVSTTIGVAGTVFGRRIGRAVSLGLAGMSTVAFISIPFFRGYYFYGSNDALTHLGWAKAMLGPDFGFFDILYPGGHSLGVFLSQTVGVPVRWGMMYAMLVMGVVTLLFVPLTVWVIMRDVRATIIAAFIAMLMLPVNNISTYPHFHSFTLTTMYFPFLLYLTFKHLTRSAEDVSLPNWMSSASLVLPIAIAANVFYHPQVAVNVLIFFGTILGVGLLSRRRSRVSYPTIADGGQQHRLLVGQVVFFAGLLLTWALQYKHTYIYLWNIVESAQGLLQSGSGIGQVAAERGGSASSIGVSLVELFIKLFAVDTLVLVLAAGLVVASAYGALRDQNLDRDMTAVYIGCSALTLGPYFVATYVGGVSGYFFRHLGFSMVLAGILAAIALYYVSDALEGALTRRRGIAVALVVMVALSLSLAAYYPSPYMYNPSAQATEQSFVGYNSVFEHRPEGAAVASIRAEAGRYSDALNEGVTNDELWQLLSEDGGKTTLQNVTTYREHETSQPFYYLTIAQIDYDREVNAYNQLRYGPRDFAYLRSEAHPRISLIQTNGEFEAYYVNQRGLSQEQSNESTNWPSSY